MSAQSSIRIIGGKWRSRKVSFNTKDTLRPTPDRVRETLFNWLSPYIVNTVCLDLYAGSGVLGLEAISRGASQVIAVENDRENVVQLEKNQSTLQATNLRVLHKNVIDWLQGEPIVSDVVFVDPPYKLHLLEPTLKLLDSKDWVHANSLIYFEQDMPISPAELPTTWSIWRQSKAGNVYYYLAQKES
jgi:16S rRNA (guanine966-N2)-methyltransferase